jgi:hypothetical protein
MLRTRACVRDAVISKTPSWRQRCRTLCRTPPLPVRGGWSHSTDKGLEGRGEPEGRRSFSVLYHAGNFVDPVRGVPLPSSGERGFERLAMNNPIP